MSSLFEIIYLLNEHRSHFFIQQFRPKSLTIYATFVGSRLEIEVFDDGHIEFSRFDGDESVDRGMDMLQKIIENLR